jgi:phosphoglucomutase
MKVVAMRDYSKAQKINADGSVEDIDSPKTNAVYYELEGGSFICIRPSGTEPKIKVYYSLKGENESVAKESFEKIKAEFEKIIK